MKPKNIKNKTLVFDLDNTLYMTHKYNVYKQLSYNIFNYISKLLNISYKEAEILSENYQNKYGTTVLGLINEHGINPKDFLSSVYDVDFSLVKQDIKLKKLLMGIDNKKIVFTNATLKYTELLLEGMGVLEYFNDIFDIYKCEYISKPNELAYEKFSKLYNISFESVLFVDDRLKNLDTATKFGADILLCNNNLTPNQLNDKIQGDNIYSILSYIKSSL